MRRITSSASWNCGSSLGCEKLVTSSLRTPESMIRSIISTFSSVGMTLGMDCSPSLAQHSQTVTDAGMAMA